MTTIIQAQLRIENYRGPGLTDDDALALAISDAESGSYSRRIGWNGDLVLNRAPPAFYRVHLEGDDVLGSIVCKKYSGGILFNLSGPPGYGGGGLHNFGVPCDVGTPNSYIVYCHSPDSSFAPDRLILENLYLSSGDGSKAPFRNLHLDGSLRVSPHGIREPVIREVSCFGTTGANVYVAGFCGLECDALRTYGIGNADAYFMGGSGYQSSDNAIAGNSEFGGSLYIGDINDTEIRANLTSIAWQAATATDVTIYPRNPPATEIGVRPATCRVL